MSPICNLFDWRQFGAWMVHVINKLHIIVGLISLVLCLDDSILLKIECWWFVTSVKMSPFTLCWCWFIIIVYMGWYNDEPSNEWTHTHIHLCIWRLPAIVDLQWWLELFTTNPFQDIQETSIWGERPYKILEDTYQFPLLSMFGLPLLDQKRYKLCGVYSKVFVLLWPQRVGNNFNGPREIISRSPELVVPREQSQEPLEKCVAKHHVPEKGFVILTSRILALCRLLHPFYKHVVWSIFIQLSFFIGCEWAIPTQTMFTLHYEIYRFPFPLLSLFGWWPLSNHEWTQICDVMVKDLYIALGSSIWEQF